MSTTASPPAEISPALIEAIKSFPTKRLVKHCGSCWAVSPFDTYANCPACGVRIKLRSFSGCTETEDLFDAVFEWINQPGVEELVQQRRAVLKAADE